MPTLLILRQIIRTPYGYDRKNNDHQYVCTYDEILERTLQLLLPCFNLRAERSALASKRVRKGLPELRADC